MAEITEINRALGALEEELNDLKNASDLIQQAGDAAELTRKTSEALNKVTKDLVQAVNRFLEKVDKIDFPTRLDKVDATISGINAGIQNIQSRFDSIERNLKDDFKSKIDIIEKNLANDFESKLSAVEEEIEKKITDINSALERRLAIIKYLLMAALFISVCSLVFLILNKFNIL